MAPMLPSAQELYDVWMAPWRPAEARDRADAGLQSDLQQLDGLTVPAAGFHLLTPDGVADVQGRLEAMVRAAEADFGKALGLPPPVGPRWLGAIEAAWPPASVSQLLRASRPEDPGNAFLVVVCELGALLGHLLMAEVPGSRWLHDWPYWESAVWHPASRTRAPVFHWALRRFSADGQDEPLAQRLAAAAGYMREQGERPQGPFKLPERNP